MALFLGTDEALIYADDADWEDRQRELNEAGFGDGLPLVLPTQVRLDRMIPAAGAPDHSFGLMPPLFGDLTVASVAYCCVLAGCVPAELPVVLTAAAATLAPEFNLLGIQTTTGTATVCVVVHGPAVASLGMNSGTNCLGPGNRANAAIGRALQLVLRNIGGARPGIADVATHGQPGKYAFCFAEGRHPIVPSLAHRRGIDPRMGAVTVIGVSGTLEVLPRHPITGPESVLLAVADAMHGTRTANGGGREGVDAEQFILIPSENFDTIAKAGWDLVQVQQFVWDHSPLSRKGGKWPLARSPENIVCIAAGGSGVKMTCLPAWGGGSMSVTSPVVALGPPHA